MTLITQIQEKEITIPKPTKAHIGESMAIETEYGEFIVVGRDRVNLCKLFKEIIGAYPEAERMVSVAVVRNIEE